MGCVVKMRVKTCNSSTSSGRDDEYVRKTAVTRTDRSDAGYNFSIQVQASAVASCLKPASQTNYLTSCLISSDVSSMRPGIAQLSESLSRIGNSVSQTRPMSPDYHLRHMNFPRLNRKGARRTPCLSATTPPATNYQHVASQPGAKVQFTYRHVWTSTALSTSSPSCRLLW